MKYLLCLLSLFFSAPSLSQLPSLSPEQTVRQIYQHYTSDATGVNFGDTSSASLLSTRMKNAIILNNQLTLPGEIGWLDGDPICDCQDYETLVLENVSAIQTNETHASVTVRFRLFVDDTESRTQTLYMVAEDGRWLIDDIKSSQGSTWQAINDENQAKLSSLASLQRTQPQDFVEEFFHRRRDYTWPWTWVVSAQYRDAVNDYYHSTFELGNILANLPRFFGQINRNDSWPWQWIITTWYHHVMNDSIATPVKSSQEIRNALQADALYIYDNPVFIGVPDENIRRFDITVPEAEGDQAKVHVRITLNDNSIKEQDLLLRRSAGAWEILDFIRPEYGSLRQKIEEATLQRRR